MKASQMKAKKEEGMPISPEAPLMEMNESSRAS